MSILKVHQDHCGPEVCLLEDQAQVITEKNLCWKLYPTEILLGYIVIKSVFFFLFLFLTTFRIVIIMRQKRWY